jgi:oligopeptide transport system substrate-binding protein
VHAILAAFARSAGADSCGPSGGGGPVEVAIIGAPERLFQQGIRLPPAAQHLRAATIEGLVALDPAGQVVPAIAERWIVTDDGISYIFRLRDSTWPDGEEITAPRCACCANGSPGCAAPRSGSILPRSAMSGR